MTRAPIRRASRAAALPTDPPVPKIRMVSPFSRRAPWTTVAEGGQVGKPDAGRLREGQTLRHRHSALLGNDHELRVGSRRGQSQDRLRFKDAPAESIRRDPSHPTPEKSRPGGSRQAGLVHAPEHVLDIARIDPGRPNLDQEVGPRRVRHRDFRDGQEIKRNRSGRIAAHASCQQAGTSRPGQGAGLRRGVNTLPLPLPPWHPHGNRAGCSAVHGGDENTIHPYPSLPTVGPLGRGGALPAGDQRRPPPRGSRPTSALASTSTRARRPRATRSSSSAPDPARTLSGWADTGTAHPAIMSG